MRRPETAGELMHFIQAINWMRTSLPELAELEAPLRALLEECLCNTRRTKRVEARRAVDSNEWTDERMAAWDAVRLRVSEAVPLNHLKPGLSVMFPDASDKFWRAVSPRFRRSSWGAALQSRTWRMSRLDF